MRKLVAALFALALLTGFAPTSGAATADRLRAANAVPPGQSGFTNIAEFAQAQQTGDYGPHTNDQRDLYVNWHYKPMQFQSLAGATTPPGDSNVTIARDSYGVPHINGATEPDLFYGIGYAMAQDRLFQMEVFRRVGHGTLADLIGSSGLPMDEQVRRLTEGPAARMAEYNALPADQKARLLRFGDGVNEYINEAQQDPNKLPAEFALLNDLPIQPWTIDDSLAFGEYAARFFGEFGHSALGAAKSYLTLVQKLGQPTAEKAFRDLYPLNDPTAPATIHAEDGTFPRHVGTAVNASYAGSNYVNHDPTFLPPLTVLARTASKVAAQEALIKQLQRELALPRWGSNAVLVSGSKAADGKPMLYSGPQTGWAIPGFFWEADMHDPARDERGVFVPAIPLMVIGRNSDSAFGVTSALDTNADDFVLQLNANDSTYVHDGQTLTLQKTTETIPCHNPPTIVLSLPNPQPCPVPDETINVYRSVYGPAIADPDSSHHIFVRRSVVDGRLIQSLLAWDKAGLQHDVAHFWNAVSTMALGFNFFYVDSHGDIAYYHLGRYPIRPSNVDPTLPIPGDGRFDWQGFEKFSDQPHVMNPKDGYITNWNNKPAVGWWSPSLESDGPSVWGDADQQQALDADVASLNHISFDRLGQVPRDVAYVDWPAVKFLPYLQVALANTTDPQLKQVLGYLKAWNRQRNDVSGSVYSTPAVVFTDRFIEHLDADTVSGALGTDFLQYAGLDTCGQATCHYKSVDNLAVPTYKFEYNVYEATLAAMEGRTSYNFLAASGGRNATVLKAAHDAVAELTNEQGSDVSKWNEPVDSGEFSAQGAMSTTPIQPLENRGSYGQVVEAVDAPAYVAAVRARPLGQLPRTGGAGGLAAVAVALTGCAFIASRSLRRRVAK